MKNIKPLVSIVCTTYNHEHYIKQTLDGFIKQQCNFPIEIIVHDDASTDNTTDIIKEYAERYSDLLKPIIQKKNQYSKGVNLWKYLFIEEAKGKYIAICEGDDYWTDTLKLQKQVDFLEANPDYGLVHTNYEIVDQNNCKLIKINNIWPSGNVFNIIISGAYHISTPSVLFKSCLYEKYKYDINERKFKMGDLPIWIVLSRFAKFKYIDDVTVAYRMLPNSASHSDDLCKVFQFQKELTEVNNYYSKKYGVKQNEKKSLSNLYKNMIKEAYFKKNKIAVWMYYKALIKLSKINIFCYKSLLFFLATVFNLKNEHMNFIYNLNNRLTFILK